MAHSARFFVLGKDKVPDWFDDCAKRGRAVLRYDEDAVLIGATLHTTSGPLKVEIGDKIIFTRAGLGVAKVNDKKEEK